MLLRIVMLLLFPVSCASAGVVTTFAGNGNAKTSGDGGTAGRAGIDWPFGVEIGPDSAIYICETNGHRIRRVDPKTSVISTVVGTGVKGYTGDGGPARKARIYKPYEVRFDAAGNMFIVEMQNHLVRKVDAKTQVISTVAGTGEAGFSGDGGRATEAKLKRPHSIELDGRGNLYICDIGNHRIRVVDLKSGTIRTFAGNGKRAATPDGAKIAGTPLNGPRALALDRKNNSLILALREGNAVYRIDLKTQTIHHIAGTGEKGYTGHGGPAKRARLSGPKGVALDAAGNIYLVDTESHTIRVIDAKTDVISTLIGDGKRGDGPNGKPTSCRMNRPHGICVGRAGKWKGVVFVGDSNNHCVRMWKR